MKKLIIPSVEQNVSNDLKKSNSFKKRDIPNITKYNIHKVNDLSSRLSKIKMENYQHDFTQSIHDVLNLYTVDEMHYSENIVFFVMEEVEKFILKSKAGEFKTQVCIECCKKYFNDDENLIILVINLLMPKLRQVRVVERQLRKVMRFFSRIILSPTHNNKSLNNHST
jgi:hypothetical protein